MVAASIADNPAAARAETRAPRAVRWLALRAHPLVFAMVLVGGATRLTESGLSITEWDLVTGTLPPLDDAAWQAEFERYRQSPQYALLNDGMSLSDFRTIYWWEWAHRELGRFIGLVYIAGFVWFAWRGPCRGGPSRYSPAWGVLLGAQGRRRLDHGRLRP